MTRGARTRVVARVKAVGDHSAVLRPVALLALTAGLAMGEAGALIAVGFTSMVGLSPQITAPAPSAVFHDLRWIFVYHPSWGAFAGEMIGMLALRTVIDTVIIALVWPPGRPRPPWRRLLGWNLAFTAVAAALLSVWVCVAFAASGTSLSWFTFGELLPVLLIALVLQRGGITPDWWRGLPPVLTMVWTLVTFLALGVSAMIVGLIPGWWAVPVAGVAGAANAGLWREIVHSTLLVRRSKVLLLRLPRVAPLATPIAVGVAAGALLLMGAVTGYGGSHGIGVPPPRRAPAAPGPKPVVLYIDGYDSSYNGSHPVTVSPGLVYEQYSYRGLNSKNLPLAYTALTTHQSLRRSAALLSRQVQVLHNRTGKPVKLLAVSEGTLVARDYLISFPHPHVDALVLLSPLVRPGRIYFPPPGANGWGVATGWELRVMFHLERAVGGVSGRPDEPFVRSVIDNAPKYRNHMLCPTPGVRTIAFLPLASAAIAPPGPLADVPVVQKPGLHAGLGRTQQVSADILRFLRGQSVASQQSTAYLLIRNAAVAWQAPALALAVNPVWDYPANGPDPSFGGAICAKPTPHG